MTQAVFAKDLWFKYGELEALRGVSFSVASGEVFGLIGPNGGGKSTTFKILSTLLRPTSGEVKIFGEDPATAPARARAQIGVVFQSPALDKRLTVRENLIYQGYLYGLVGVELRKRIDEFSARLGIADRLTERVAALSGGLKRRVELAKGMLHRPRMLILDEPTTGLDPLARRELWTYLRGLNADAGVTLLLTTHLLDEADDCHQIAFLDQGRVVVAGQPGALKDTLGGDVISVRSPIPDSLKDRIVAAFHTDASIVGGEVRIRNTAGHELVSKLVAMFPEEIDSVTLGKPTLEELFIQKTGRRFWEPAPGKEGNA